MGQRLPDGVDAPVHAMEPPIADPAGDPLVADAEREQLRPVDHSVLARSHAEKPLLDVQVGELFVHLDG